jgi:tRNA(Arg) A34 adenosine deaminase TadA
MKAEVYRNAWTRRRLIGWGGGLLGSTTLLRLSTATAADSVTIVQPSNPTPDAFTKRAFEMRDLAVSQGDQGYGAVIVHAASSKIVGQSPSRVVTNRDPSAHAEMEAIRDATRRLRTRDLSKHVMYSSSRPCAMCEAAAHWANIDTLYFGRSTTPGGPPNICPCR